MKMLLVLFVSLSTASAFGAQKPFVSSQLKQELRSFANKCISVPELGPSLENPSSVATKCAGDLKLTIDRSSSTDALGTVYRGHLNANGNFFQIIVYVEGGMDADENAVEFYANGDAPVARYEFTRDGAQDGLSVLKEILLNSAR